MDKNKQKAIIEAVLFSMGEAVSIKKLAEVIDADEKTTRALIEEIKTEMDEESRGITINEIGDAFQMCSKTDMYEYLIDLTNNSRRSVLSDTALETLSIIAYKQPVTRLDVEKIRGVDCSHAINKLLEYDLIRELGRMDAPGRPILFGTTEQFLRSFGVKSLEQLPELSQVQKEEFREQAEAEVGQTLSVGV